MSRLRIDRLWQTIGERVRDARYDACMTQGELAELVFVTRTSIVNLEAGRQRMPVDQLIKIARVLNKPAEWLIEGF